jgi:hypothetical protein
LREIRPFKKSNQMSGLPNVRADIWLSVKKVLLGWID